MKRKPALAKWLVTGAVLLAAGLGIASSADQWRFARSGAAEIRFFDVGEGDAALIRSADGRAMLIDGGPDDSVSEGLAAAVPWWRRRLDVLVITHLDGDHFTGLTKVLRDYRVDEIWWNGSPPATASARRFMASAVSSRVRLITVRPGEAFDFGGGRGFEVLGPASLPAGSDTNSGSIVGKFVCGEESALFTGDLPSAVEKKMIDGEAPLRATVLKVAHHGSKSSTSEAFLDAVRPRDAVISVGPNGYGHPAFAVLERLLSRGVAVHRTDREGEIDYVCENGRLSRAVGF